MAVDRFELTRSIIHKCPALKLPQTFLQKLGMTAQIVPLHGLTQEQAQVIADRLNAAPNGGPDDLNPDELALLARVDEEFADCGETNVDPAVLLDFAKRGYLECTRFEFTDKGAQTVFRHIHGESDAADVTEVDRV